MTNCKKMRERIAEILSKNISYTGQIGVLNIHHAVHKLDDLLNDERSRLLAELLNEIELASCEHIQIGGLRFDGISMRQVEVIFKKHGHVKQTLF